MQHRDANIFKYINYFIYGINEMENECCIKDTLDGEEDSFELLMHNIHTLPKNCKKYWSKRYSLFSKYDEGIYMTAELWYSVTPEEIAVFTAQYVKDNIPDAKYILDLCSGGGGNTIQFANYFPSVGAIDVEKTNMKCLLHNASIYGVEDKIWSKVASWKDLSAHSEKGVINTEWIPKKKMHKHPKKPFDFIFCSPPWGGPSYSSRNADYSLYDMQPFSIEELICSIQKYTDNFGLFLPRNSSLDELDEVSKRIRLESKTIKVIYVSIEAHCKGMLAFFGPKFA